MPSGLTLRSAVKKMWPEVIEAMDYAVQNKADMEDLHDAVGRRIAELVWIRICDGIGWCDIGYYISDGGLHVRT